MSCGKSIVDQIRPPSSGQDLEQQRVTSDSSGKSRSVSAHDGDLRIDVDVADSDRLGVGVSEIRLETDDVSPNATAAIDGQIERAAEAIGFRGGFELVEQEPQPARAVLRTRPEREDGGRYFELTLEGGNKATIRHFNVDENHRRLPRPAIFGMDELENAIDEAGRVMRPQDQDPPR